MYDWPVNMKSVHHIAYDFTSDPLTVEQSHKRRRHSCLSVACTSDIAKHADGQQSMSQQRSEECVLEI